MGDVTTITTARNNAELICLARNLGYLRDDWVTVDPTWGEGKFWTLWRPLTLLASDLDPAKCPPGVEPVDMANTPYPDSSADAYVLDGPYKLNGTSTGKGAAASDAQYGVDGPNVRWQDRHALICAGINEALRVLRPGGFLLNKCQDQVCSGQKRWQTRIFADHAEAHGSRLVDQLHLVGGRKQPEGRRVVHSRQNYSTLQIFQRSLRG